MKIGLPPTLITVLVPESIWTVLPPIWSDPSVPATEYATIAPLPS
ncbi:hypothetical protein [Candidatus Burkholderia verschuerenii]|nr:hypothetical protein [Candidatus Burkholderia verschuerenii]